MSTSLVGRRIALCLTGSVAVLRSVDLARLLIRHGAEVTPIMSDAATKLIGPDLLEWATGQKPVCELTGAIEHVALAGNVKGHVDLVVVAPATANTVGKIAAGIDDTPVTTVVTTALGQGIPVLVVPAMHEPMYRHPIVLENLQKLADHGVALINPVIEEGKAKIPTPETICEAVLSTIGGAAPGALTGKRVLITAGRTVEYIDPIRVLTNNSSGKMGMAIAASAKRHGAEVTLIYGKGTADPPPGISVRRVDTSEQMLNAVFDSLASVKQDIFIAAAAVGDWRPKKTAAGKITTHGSDGLTLELVPTPKIIDSVRAQYPDLFLVAFRALHGLSRNELIENAFGRMEKAGADMIAVNDVSKAGTGFETDTNEIYIIDRSKKIVHVPLTDKSEVAEKLLQSIINRITS